MKGAVIKTYIAVLFALICLLGGIGLALHADHPQLNMLDFSSAWTENAFMVSGGLMIVITVVMYLTSLLFAAKDRVAGTTHRQAQPNYSQPQQPAYDNRERRIATQDEAPAAPVRPKKQSPARRITSSEDLEARLHEIVGLEDVKQTIREIYATALVEKRRRAQGIGGDSSMSIHMAFKGNPGTGKTTIARIVGEMFRDLGLLSTGEFVEVDQSELVSQYVGHTPKLVMEYVQKAMGGVLFIDEAYALAPQQNSGGPSHGKEAIDTLIKAMEDYRDDLCVIVAGYDGPMDKFFAVNEGMKSRIPFVLKFTDYNVEQFMQILAMEAGKKQYIITQDAMNFIAERMYSVNIGKEGNGRFARNLLEAAIRKQSLRLVNVKRPSREELLTLTLDDFQF